jgi:hypothetical protein
LKPEIKKEVVDEKEDPKNHDDESKAKGDPEDVNKGELEGKEMPAGKGDIESKKKQKKVN